MITLKQFTGAQVVDKDDATLYGFLSGNVDCLFYGCMITTLGANRMHITSGRGIIKGRCFEVQESDLTVSLAAPGQTNPGRIYIEINTGNAGNPIDIKSVATASLPDLVQQDINKDGTVYQFEIAKYTATATEAKDIKATGIIRPTVLSAEIFFATFRLDGWQKSGNVWTQTASCTGMKAAYDTEDPWIYKTGNTVTDAELQDGLNKLCAGSMETLEGAIKATVPHKPTCDVPVYLRRSVTQ